jgi:hypothetical protein
MVSACSRQSQDVGDADDTPAEQPAETTAAADATAGPTARIAVFLVDGEVVVPVSREVPAGDLDAVAAALFAGPAESDRGALGTQLTTEIPADAEVVSISRSGAEVRVDVTEPFITDGGALGMQLRLAQLAYTLTALQDVDEVLLTVSERTVRLVGDGLEIENPLDRQQYAAVAPEVLIESPLPADDLSSPIYVSGTTVTSGTEFILRLTDTQGTIVTERLVASDGENGVFGVEVEYEGAEPGPGTLYALSLEEDVLMGVTIGLE